MHDSLSSVDVDILTLFDDVVTLLNVAPFEGQDSPDLPKTIFSTKEVEVRSVITQLLRFSVCSVIDSSLIDKSCRVIEVLVAEHMTPLQLLSFSFF